MIKYMMIILSAATFFLTFIFDSRPGFAQHSWEYYYEKGLIQYRAGMYDYSIFHMNQCLEANPDCFQAANVMAEIYRKKNNIFKSIYYYKLSIRINENQPDILNSTGELYESTGDRELAFRHFIRVTDFDKNHVKANCNLVRFFLKKNEAVSAGLHLQISNTQALRRSGGALLNDISALKRGDLEKAALLYGMLIKECPCLPDAYMGLYDTRRLMHDYKGAADVLEQLKFVKPDHEKAYLLLGDLYFTQKLPGKRKLFLERAVSNLLKAIELNPDNYEACYALSVIYHHIRKDIEAKMYEDRARAIEKRVEGVR
jgi:tetratricopeptide (TPR) repeat protein